MNFTIVVFGSFVSIIRHCIVMMQFSTVELVVRPISRISMNVCSNGSSGAISTKFGKFSFVHFASGYRFVHTVSCQFVLSIAILVRANSSVFRGNGGLKAIDLRYRVQSARRKGFAKYHL